MIRLSNVDKRHGSQALFVESSMSVFRGDKVGLVGPNGSGKTTVFRLITGEESPDTGTVVVDKGATVGYFDQDVGEMKGSTVVAQTMAGAGEVSEVAAELAELEQKMSDPAHADSLDKTLARFGEIQTRFDELGGYSLEARAREILAGLGFTQSRMDDDVGLLSGGWKMRVALARILLMEPDALLLDEPTNHLDLESILWLERFLRDFEGALILTSHDRELMNRIVTKIVDIDGGELTTYTGDYAFFETQRDIATKQQQAQFDRQEAMLKKERDFIARFKARASHAAQVQSRVKKLDKIDKIEPPKVRKVVDFEFADPPRSGEDVAALSGVSKAYSDLVLYKDFDLLIRRKERWCVMGINGAGKSTLLKLVAGELAADSGEVRVGASVRMGYFAQHSMETLRPNETVTGALEREHPRASVGSLRKLAGAFGFSGDDVEKPCRILSGGEKARLALAQMLYVPPNFLVLDEPTNHLDIETKEMLIRALSSYEGTMLFVSHDRQFLRALSNRVLELGTEEPLRYGGGYVEYVEQSGQEAPGLLL